MRHSGALRRPHGLVSTFLVDSLALVDNRPGLRLAEFSLIDDTGRWRATGASFADARACSYGCGLFRFEKPCAS